MTKLTRIKSAFLTGIVAVSMLVTSMTASAETIPHAATEENNRIVLPISQTFETNGAQVDTEVSYKVTPVTEENNGVIYNTQDSLDFGKITYTIDNQENVGTFSIDGTSTKDITFTWSTPGFYVLDLTMTDEDKDHYTYDSTTYRIRVYVRNRGDSFVTVQNLTTEETPKVDALSFTHSYKAPGKGGGDGKDDGGDGYGSVKVTNTKAQDIQHIVAIKQWANTDNVAIPESITLELTKDGVPTGVTQTVSAANNWTVDFGLVPVDGAVYDIVESRVPEGYAVSYQKAVDGKDVIYTVTNTYTRQAAIDGHDGSTGDDSHMMLYAGVMGAAVICLAVWFIVNKRTR